MDVPIMGGAYEGRSSDVSPQTCINLFYEKGTDGGESLVATPGSTVFSTPAVAEVRGGIAYNNLAYFVVGSTLYEIDSAGAATSRGTLLTSKGRVSMAHSGTRTGEAQQIMIVDGTAGYIYDNLTSTLTQIADTDFTNSQSVVNIDGYFIYAEKDSDKFWYSTQYDGTAWSGTDFSVAEGDPDQILALIADRRELFIFGEKTLEVWYNSGDTDNLFQRFQGGFTQTGCVALYSPARVDNNIYWLTANERGDGLVAMLGEGYQPNIISSPEMARQVSRYTTISDAFGYTYQSEGHEFYVLTFPSEKATWVFDASTKVWHKRAHVISSEFPHRERYNCYVFAFGKHLVGDYTNGKIYELDTDVGTIDGTAIPRERITASVSSQERRIRINEFQLDMEEGAADPNATTNTNVWLSYSKDGGHTFSNEQSASMGAAGERSHRIIWRRLGQGRNWIFKVRTWSTNRVLIKGAYARVHGKREA